MAVATYNVAASMASDAAYKSWLQALIGALDAFADITRVADSGKDLIGHGKIDFTDKTGSAVTTTSGTGNLTGTFDGGGLTAADVGRIVRVPGAGAAGAEYRGEITAVTGAGAATVAPNFGTSIAGSGTAVVGVMIPVASRASNGLYAIYRFNDAHQAACPCFIKFTFINSAGAHGFAVSIGRATDGSGNLHAATDTNTVTLVASTTARDNFLSCAPGRLQVGLDVGAAQNPAWSIARSVDDAGATTDEYVEFNQAKPGVSARHQTLNKLGIPFPATALTNLPSGIPSDATTASYGGSLGLFPVHPFRGRMDNPTMGMMTAIRSDVPLGSTGQMTLYGALRTFMMVCGAATSGSPNNNQNAGYGIRYE